MANDANKVKYRRLEIGEVVETGDEYQSEETKIWTRVPTAVVGNVIGSDHLPHRRLCLCGAQQPQHCDLTALVADLRERMARLEHRFAAASEIVAPPQPDPASPAEGPRTDDLAKVTAERDAALRVARVILEVTWRPEKNLEPPAKWRWQDFVNLSGDPLGPGESVRVVDETAEAKWLSDAWDSARQAYSDGLARVTRERDAAIKEGARLRDVVRQLSVKQFVQPHETSRARVVDEGDESSVGSMKCVAELERERDAALAVRDGLTAERDAARAEAEWLRLSLAACAVIADCNTPESLDRHRQVCVEYDCAAVQAVIAAVEREIALRARVADLERAYSAECDTSAQAHRELSDLNDAIRARESGEERDGSYATQCREAAAARDCADRMIPAPAGAPASPAEGLCTDHGHRWDSDGERCVKCRDKSWMGGPCNTSDDEFITRLTAERDLARAVQAGLRASRDAAHAEAERLRARVAELEAAAKTAALLAEVRESEWRVASELAAEANAENARGEAEEACAPASPANGLRKERVVLEIEHRKSTAHEWAWRQMIHLDENRGESVRVVDETEAMKCMTKFRRERDAAQAERDAAHAEAERLKAQIVALEGHSRMDIEREIAVEEAWERCGIEPHWPGDEAGSSQRYAASMEQEIGRLRARVAELEAASAVPSWPRGWLTAEERDSVDHAADIIEDMEDDDGNSLKKKADALRAILARPSSEPCGWLTAEEREAVAELLPYTYSEMQFDRLQNLLARSSPPRVKVPPRPVYHDSDYGDGQNKAWKECAAAYTAAIREAGGEVEVKNE